MFKILKSYRLGVFLVFLWSFILTSFILETTRGTCRWNLFWIKNYADQSRIWMQYVHKEQVEKEYMYHLIWQWTMKGKCEKKNL